MATPEHLIRLALGCKYPATAKTSPKGCPGAWARGVDPLHPAAPVLAYDTRQISHGPNPLHT